MGKDKCEKETDAANKAENERNRACDAASKSIFEKPLKEMTKGDKECREKEKEYKEKEKESLDCNRNK